MASNIPGPDWPSDATDANNVLGLEGATVISDEQLAGLVETRARHPVRIEEAARARPRRQQLDDGSGLLLVAADHPARAILGAGEDPLAIADRRSLLDRILIALENPAVDGLLATPDIVDDLLLLGALDEKIVIGSMNRTGLTGSTWELDDRFNCYDTPGVVEANLDGGKMLMRIDLTDPGSNSTMEACARAVSALSRAGVMAMIEPLPTFHQAGRAHISTDTEDLVRAISVANALGTSSARTWLKLPAVEDMERVMAATTLPTLLLGGDPGADADRVFSLWRRALALPQVRGLVAGRTILYPHDGDVRRAVETAARIMDRG